MPGSWATEPVRRARGPERLANGADSRNSGASRSTMYRPSTAPADVTRREAVRARHDALATRHEDAALPQRSTRGRRAACSTWPGNLGTVTEGRGQGPLR